MKSMNKLLKIYWAFYKSTLTVNLVVSLTIGLISSGYGFAIGITVFAISLVSIGLFFAFLYKEVAFPQEYYFYYNLGISKIRLMIFCFLVSILLSAFILIIVHYATSS